MSDAQPRFTVPAAVVETVVAATGRNMPLPLDVIDALADWLTHALGRAVRRARTKPLTGPDVERLIKAYQQFQSVIEDLQDRTLPPPRLPAEGGVTAWDNWRETYEQFGYVRGRRESTDWLLIGALLALYETVSGRTASAAQDEGPTMQFLRNALGEFRKLAPPDVREMLTDPKVDALKHRLPGLRRRSLWHAKRRLADIPVRAG